MKHIVSRMTCYFPNRWPLSYLNLTKTMKTHIRRQQHKNNFKHQDIKQKEPPQKYRLGTIGKDLNDICLSLVKMLPMVRTPNVPTESTNNACVWGSPMVLLVGNIFIICANLTTKIPVEYL